MFIIGGRVNDKSKQKAYRQRRDKAGEEDAQRVQSGQSAGLLIVMTVLPLILMYLSYYLYQRKYKLDEAEYERICAAIRDRNQDELTA